MTDGYCPAAETLCFALRANQKIRMVDATVAPQVGCISPFGTTVCNVNHSNASAQPHQKAGAQRTLSGVGSPPAFGYGCGMPRRAPLARLCLSLAHGTGE